MKKCFREWHEEWWTIRKEWGLSVRADLHNRCNQKYQELYRSLCLFCSRHIFQLVRIAVNSTFYAYSNRYRLWNMVWLAWREYTVIHRVKTAQKKIAERHGKY